MTSKLHLKLSTGIIINITLDECKELYTELHKLMVNEKPHDPFQKYGSGEMIKMPPYQPIQYITGDGSC